MYLYKFIIFLEDISPFNSTIVELYLCIIYCMLFYQLVRRHTTTKKKEDKQKSN